MKIGHYFLFFFGVFLSTLLSDSVSLGGITWYDKNLDGIKDYGEFGVGKVKVELLKDGVPTGDINYTDIKGIYLFEGLEPNRRYSIRVTLPRNYIHFTKPNVNQNGIEDIPNDSDIITVDKIVEDDIERLRGTSEEILLIEGMHYRDLDAGMLCKCIAWVDIEKYTNGKDADSEDSAVEVEVGSKVTWEYKVKNSSFVTIYNIKVVDDKEGEIECPKDTLEPGEEMSCFKSGIAKEGLYKNLAEVTAEDENGSKVDDSDVSHYIGKNTLGCIGNFYWLDENLNGIQDRDEAGVVGVKVQLYNQDKELLKETLTDSSGKYLFCDLPAGDYYLKFDIKDSYLFIPKDMGSSDILDSDVDSSGWSHLVRLDSGEIDLSIDAGIYCSCEEGIVTGVTEDSASISIVNVVIVSFIISFIALTLGDRDDKKIKKKK